MRNFTKKFFVGLLGSALIFTGSQAMAAPSEMPGHGKDWQKEAAANIDGWSKYFSEKYGVDSAQIEKALKDGVHIDDIHSAAVLAKISGKSFSDVLAMKVDWPQVAEKLGVTRDQLKEFNKQEHEKMLVERTGLDIQTLNSLRKEGYSPRDIGIAAKIAKMRWSVHSPTRRLISSSLSSSKTGRLSDFTPISAPRAAFIIAVSKLCPIAMTSPVAFICVPSFRDA